MATFYATLAQPLVGGGGVAGRLDVGALIESVRRAAFVASQVRRLCGFAATSVGPAAARVRSADRQEEGDAVELPGSRRAPRGERWGVVYAGKPAADHPAGTVPLPAQALFAAGQLPSPGDGGAGPLVLPAPLDLLG